MSITSFLENKKSIVNLLIELYLWGFIVGLSIMTFYITLPVLGDPIESFPFILKVIVSVLLWILALLTFTSPIGLLLLIVLYKKTNKLNTKVFDKNKISFPVEKYSKYFLIISFFLIIPIILLTSYLAFDKNNLIYYFAIAISAIAPLFVVHLYATLYNILTNLREKNQWKKFAFNIFFYIILFFYFNTLISLTMNTI